MNTIGTVLVSRCSAARIGAPRGVTITSGLNAKPVQLAVMTMLLAVGRSFTHC